MEKIHIKNMVCPRCIRAVEMALRDLGISYDEVELGKIILPQKPTKEKVLELDDKLNQLGFELIDDSAQILVSKVKSLLINYLEKVELGDDIPKKSEYLSQNLFKNYTYISKVFSDSEQQTVEKYWIALKTERAKELLETDEFSITEIAHRLGYSSSQYFANQFRNETGKTPTRWKSTINTRKGLQNID